jgi:hypothetical protein
MLNIGHAKLRDIVLHARLHLCKELQGPQHCHQWYPHPHMDQCYKKAIHIASVIFQSRCWHVGERNWHGHAYVNPLLILKASQAFVCKSQKSLPLPYVWFLWWKMSLVHISELCLQVVLGHQIRLLSEWEVHSYQALDLMDHLFWNGKTMLIAWTFEHSHLKL